MNLDAKVNNQIKRNDWAAIFASNRQLAALTGVRLAPTSSDRKAGLVLGRITASGLYAEYDDTHSDGTETAVGILFEDVLVEDISVTQITPSGTAVARMITGGEVFKDKLIGLDSNGETDLNARTIVGADGVSVLKF